MGCWKLVAGALCAAALSSTAASAEPPPEPGPGLPRGAYSHYERQTILGALRRYHVMTDAAPDGKVIEQVAVEVLDVIEDRDPLPNFLNLFHCTTRQRAVTRELLFREGQRYDTGIVQETERNLRALPQQSLVVIVPVVGSAPDKVRVLVLIKDVWSLRLNTDFRITPQGLEYLLVQPSEENVFGMHRSLSTQAIYNPQTIAIGAGFSEPRLADSRIALSASAAVIINHRTKRTEGTFGAFDYGLPLYSTRQKWAWGGSVAWRQEVTRRFTGVQVNFFRPGLKPGEVNPCFQVDDASCIPYTYNSDVLSGSVGVTRSFGVRVKQDLNFTLSADRRSFSPADVEGRDPAAVREFVEKRVPLSDTRNGPAALYHVYLNRYVQMLDVETLALQESFRVGPEAYARSYPILRVLGSSHDLLGWSLSAAYTQALPDALVRLYAAAGIEQRLPSGGEPYTAAYNAALQGGLRIVSPRFFIGRLIYDGTFTARLANAQHTITTLGGEGRLRGYLSAVLTGENFLASNIEFRSRPVQLWTFQLAGAAFYDVGDVFDSWHELHPKQGVGFGLRLGFPQLQRSVMRIDWGFRLTPGVMHKNLADGLVVTFGQAFGFPNISGSGVTR
jgi:hypothetical protein